MKMVDSVLAEGVNRITTLISQTIVVNANFNEAKSVMQDAGTALMGIGRATGENRAEKAAREATSSPLLDLSIEGATGVLYNIIGGSDLTMQEVNKVSQLIGDAVDPSANIKFGATINDTSGEEITITIVATGFDSSKQVYTQKFKGDPEKVNSLIDKEVEEVLPEDASEVSEKTEVTAEDLLDSIDKGEENLMTEEKLDDINDIPAVTNGEDPLDIPAFMRRKKRK